MVRAQIVFNAHLVEELAGFSHTGEDLLLEATLSQGVTDSARLVNRSSQ